MISVLVWCVGELLPDDGIARQAALFQDLDHGVEFGPEAERLNRGSRSPFEAEQCVGDRPPVVDPTEDVVLGRLGIGVEDLVEVAVTGDVDDRANLDARLIHGHEQERDAGVFGDIGVGPAEREDHVGVPAGGGPDLLAVDDPLVAVELGLAAEPGEIATGIGLGVALAPEVGCRRGSAG